MMSERERRRLVMVQLMESGGLTQREGARRLGVSERQARRIVARWRAEGDAGLVHRARGKPSNRRTRPELSERVMRRVEEGLIDHGPTLASEVLAGEGLRVHPETLRRWMRRAGLKAAARRGKRRRRMRPRRERFGELIQLDTSIHPWLGPKAERCVLIAMIDDATSRLWARFFPGEGAGANMGLLRDYLGRFGRPAALYTDQASHFVSPGRALDAEEIYQGQRAQSQIQRALGELGIAHIVARSPEAKGRIERCFRTLQDRLVKALAREKIQTIPAANAYLERVFLGQWNRKFAQEPRRRRNAHRSARGYDLDAILSLRTPRTVGRDYTIRHAGQRWQIDPDRAPRSLEPGERIEVQDRLDGKRVLMWEGKPVAFAAAGRDRGLGPVGLRPPSPRPRSPKATSKPKPDHPWRTGHF